MDEQKKLVKNPYYRSNTLKWFFIIRMVVFLLISVIVLYFILLPNPILYFSLTSLFFIAVAWFMYKYMWKEQAVPKYLALALIFVISFMLIVVLLFELKNIFK